MSQTDELLQDLDSEVVDDDLVDADREPEESREAERSRSSGRTGGLRRRIAGVFSPRAFLVAFVLTLGGFLAASVVPLVGGIVGLVGIFAAGVLVGVLGRRGYPELFVAGAATAGVGLLLDQLVLSVVGGFALPLAAVGATAGAVAAVLGYYFGRDLRNGLTRSL